MLAGIVALLLALEPSLPGADNLLSSRDTQSFQAARQVKNHLTNIKKASFKNNDSLIASINSIEDRLYEFSLLSRRWTDEEGHDRLYAAQIQDHLAMLDNAVEHKSLGTTEEAASSLYYLLDTALLTGQPTLIPIEVSVRNQRNESVNGIDVEYVVAGWRNHDDRWQDFGGKTVIVHKLVPSIYCFRAYKTVKSSDGTLTRKYGSAKTVRVSAIRTDSSADDKPSIETIQIYLGEP